MATRVEETPHSKKKRAAIACDFCRRRKMKCNGEKPKCFNCTEHRKDCVYDRLPQNPRPSMARIIQLEQENRKLQETLSNLKVQTKPMAIISEENRNFESPDTVGSQQKAVDNRPCKASSTSQVALHTELPTFSITPVNEMKFSPDNESCYHGPTSRVFDENSVESLSQNQTSVTKVPELWVKRQLIAESANQRQLETVNFLDRKLDFDGVDPELGMHLLSLYWSRQQSQGPLVYRTVFMRDMASSGTYFSKLLLNAMYFYACKYTSRSEVRQDSTNVLTAGWTYRQRAADLLQDSFDTSKITTIQALLIMSNALYTWCDEKSASWLYAGIAFNMVTDLGLHVDVANLKYNFSDEDLEIRRRVFWTAYVIDKTQSLYQGKPIRLRERDANLSMSFLDDHEELELFDAVSYTGLNSFPTSPVHSISTFAELGKLSIILERILQTLYTEKIETIPPDHLLRTAHSVHAELQIWRASLPRHFTIEVSDTPRKTLPHCLTLLALYNVLIILLHRPFVSSIHPHSAPSSTALDAFSSCSFASFEISDILKSYEQSFCVKAIPDILSYAAYVSATIHVRIIAQDEHRSDARHALRNCLDILTSHQAVCWWPRRAIKIINSLMSRLRVVAEENLSTTTSDLVESNFDIEAIIRSFGRDQPAHGTPIHQTNSLVQGGHLSSNGAEEIAVASSTNAIGEQDIWFGYDPIYGFNGSAFDSLDLELE